MESCLFQFGTFPNVEKAGACSSNHREPLSHRLQCITILRWKIWTLRKSAPFHFSPDCCPHRSLFVLSNERIQTACPPEQRNITMVTVSIDSWHARKVGSVEPFQWKHCRYLLLQALPTGFPEKLEPVVSEIKMLVEIVMDWDEICNEDIEQWSSIPCRFPSPKDFWSLTRPWQLQHPSFINE